MIESETTASLSNTDIRRALFWTKRWRAIGGFFVYGDEGWTPARSTNPDPKLEKHYSAAHGELLKELKHDPRKKRTVVALVEDAASRRIEKLVPSTPDPEPDNDPAPAA